ncbi:hypothetical protein ABZ234_08585 [Nocardiopsis sp. NPDC006198]|uniref:hypothetical protein n=1 Tax=Nocardiopsis sp. NPDC006198 TaxID=3154472 RepID=UPI0033AA1485
MPTPLPVQVHTHLEAAAAVLRAAAPLPPVSVHYDPDSDFPVQIRPEPTVTSARQDVAVRRLARALGAAPIVTDPDGASTEGYWEGTGIAVGRLASDARATFSGHGRTGEHADLLHELAPWVAQVLDQGATQVWVGERAPSQAEPVHALTLAVFADTAYPDLVELYAVPGATGDASRHAEGLVHGRQVVLVKED